MSPTTTDYRNALTAAATAGGLAPSIHNTQPWHWRVRSDRLELWAVTDRQLAESDADGRLMTVSCGAALHHARVALAAEGYQVVVRRLPDVNRPALLAIIEITGRQPVTPRAMRLYQAINVRYTDRRPVTGERPTSTAVERLTDAAVAQGVHLAVLSRDQTIELAVAAAHAQEAEISDPSIRAELEYWTGPQRPANTGIPAGNIPADVPQTTVPGRDFGRPGTLRITAEHDTGAVYGILNGLDDLPRSWLRAGEALSAVWLLATELGISVLPMSAAVELPVFRSALRRILNYLGYPYLVLRLGIADPDEPGPARTPRLSAPETIELTDD
jgi:nitroreductase